MSEEVANQEQTVEPEVTEEQAGTGSEENQDGNVAEVDWDNMSEEDFEQHMENIRSGSTDYLESDKDKEIPEQRVSEEPADIAQQPTDNNDNNDNEVEGTTEPNDDSDQGSEENTASTDKDDQDANDGKTEETSDENKPADEPEVPENFKQIYEEYKQLKEFQEQLGTEFVANGKKVKGSLNPQELIKAQQMAMGLSKRFEAFNKYRPYLKPLQDRKLIENEEQFNLMLSVMDGDKEAIKKLIKDKEIDIVDLDTDEINYQNESKVADDIQVKAQDFLERLEDYGVQDKADIVNNWDGESVYKVLNEPAVRDDLLTHMANGAFDGVMNKVEEKKLKDFSGRLSSVPTIDLYIETARELAAEYEKNQQGNQQAQPTETPEQKEANRIRELEEKLKKVEAEKKKIEEERKKSEYEAKVRAEEAKRKQQKQSAMVSTQVPTFADKVEEFDPMKLND